MAKVLKKVLLFTLGFVAVAYAGLSVFFMSHFTMQTTINGVDVAYATADEAYRRIAAAEAGYSLTITGKNKKTDVLTPEDIGMVSNIDAASVEDVLKTQQPYFWVLDVINPEHRVIKDAISFDRKVVKAKLKTLDCAKSGDNESKNATVAFSQNHYEIVPEEIGDVVDEKVLLNTVCRSLTNLDTEINMEAEGCYLEPKIHADDERLKECCDQLNEYVKNEFVYTVGNEKVKITPEQKSQWFTVNENYEIALNEELVGEFLTEMSERFNTVGKAKPLHSTALDEDIMVPAGWYGWKIDKEEEAKQLVIDLTSGEDVERDFIYSQSAASHGEKDYGDTYIEVDLTEQHVYVYKDGELFYDTKCVTGNVLNNCDTHEGAYSIVSKEKDRVLRGADYETPVKNWMPFHNGEGLHDATWRGAFGGKIYQGGGSHGCVNLPLKAANKIYDYAKVGTPVLVFYTGNTKNEVNAMKNFVNKVNAIPEAEDKAGAIYAAMNAYGSVPDANRPKVNAWLGTLEGYKSQYGVY